MLASGCATIKQGVVGTTRADIAPFATEAMNTLSVEPMEIRRSRVTRLGDYFDDNTAEINDLTSVVEKVEEFRRSIALYSLELVHIAGMDKEPSEKSQQLAEYLQSEFAERLVSVLGFEQAELSSIIDNIRGQEKFLDAIRAVQPLITEAAAYHETLLRELETVRLPAMTRYFETAIKEDFASVVQQEATLRRRRDQIMEALQVLDRAAAGNAAASSQLNGMPAFWLDASRPPLRPSQDQLLTAESYLIAELRKNAEILDLIGPSLAIHAEARDELNGLARTVVDGIKRARFQLAAWRKAHTDLGNGVKDPGSWLSAAYGAARII